MRRHNSRSMVTIMHAARESSAVLAGLHIPLPRATELCARLFASEISAFSSIRLNIGNDTMK